MPYERGNEPASDRGGLAPALLPFGRHADRLRFDVQALPNQVDVPAQVIELI